MAVCGGYIAYHESKQSIQEIDHQIFLHLDISYKSLPLYYVIVGTALWGYGDLLVKWASL